MKHTEFKFKTPKEILIGDPHYIEKYAENLQRLSSLTYHKNIPNDFVSEMSIVTDRKDDNGVPSHCTDFKIVFAKDMLIKANIDEKQGVEYCSLLTLYLNGYELVNTSAKKTALGCDTACFDIYVDKNIIHFYTLSDGLYGEVTEYYKDNELISIVFDGWLDKDAYEHEELVSNFKTLFNVK